MIKSSAYDTNETVSYVKKNSEQKQVANYHKPIDTIDCKYFDEKSFFSALNKINEQKISKNDYTGGIMPHHLLADHLILELLSSFKKAENIEHIIVIGPNHKRKGAPIITSSRAWDTPFGIMEGDSEIATELYHQFYADKRDDVLEEEHSISSLVPYIKYIMPNASITPIILHGNYNYKDCLSLAELLSKYVKEENAIVLASIDFSHYLNTEKADSMDKITIDAISNYNYDSIRYMTNDNLDSPPSLITFLEIMKNCETTEFVELNNSNSYKITGLYPNEVTSYFTLLYK